ncbi:MAG: hypothetical protein U1E21_17140 [Reyranellaceae bacterium]
MHDESRLADAGSAAGGSNVAGSHQEEPLATVPLAEQHRVADFRCSKSQRINDFFAKECPLFLKNNYCRVFVLANPDDPTDIWGYYTLSPSLLLRAHSTNSDQRKVPSGLPIPMVRIGFMGRSDSAPKGLGSALIVDAARRVHRNRDLAAWGLMLDAEGGPGTKLWTWYLEQGFMQADAKNNTQSGVMYGALKKFLPELQQQQQ